MRTRVGGLSPSSLGTTPWLAEEVDHALREVLLGDAGHLCWLGEGGRGVDDGLPEEDLADPLIMPTPSHWTS